MSSAVIVTTPDELRSIVRAAVEEVLAARTAASAAEPSEWIDTAVAAALLGVSTRQVAKMAASAKDRPALLASSRVGRLLRFRRADVLAVLDRRDG